MNFQISSPDAGYPGNATSARHQLASTCPRRRRTERAPEQTERLAYHALRAGLWEKAVAYLHRAALRAITLSANREAVIHLEQALEALRRRPETRQTVELAIDLRFDLRNALVPLADVARMERYLREAEALARALGDQRRLAGALHRMVMPRMNAGDYDDALIFGREALAIGTALVDPSIEVPAAFALGMVHDVRG